MDRNQRSEIKVDKPPYQLVHQGDHINNEMKNDIIDLFFKSITEDRFQNRAEFIKKELEIKYGRVWSIILTQADAFFSHSFLFSEDLLLELKTSEYVLLAYLSPLPPELPPPPPPPIRCTLPPPIGYERLAPPPPIYQLPPPPPPRYEPSYERLSSYQEYPTYQRSYYYPPPPPPPPQNQPPPPHYYWPSPYQRQNY